MAGEIYEEKEVLQALANWKEARDKLRKAKNARGFPDKVKAVMNGKPNVRKLDAE